MSRQDNKLSYPTCVGCHGDYRHTKAATMHQYGATMHLGDHFCIEGKRARKFHRSDPKSRCPEWCPKRKDPCELRVYGFINEDERAMHSFYCDHFSDAPESRRYGVRYEGTTPLTPQKFWGQYSSGVDVSLPHEVALYEVLEIDDGIKPVYFYRSTNGFRIESYFKGEDARSRKAMTTTNREGEK